MKNLEAAQAELRRKLSSPEGRSVAARAAKDISAARAKLSVKRELKKARRYKKVLRDQKKRYAAHKKEFRNKVTWAMRDAWRETMDTCRLLRASMLEAEATLRRKVSAAGEGEASRRALDVAKGYQMGLEAAKAAAAQKGIEL